MIPTLKTFKEAKGNLIDLALEGHFDVIAHGCNCQNVMAVGIAKEIKDRIPQAELEDYKCWKVFKSGRNDMLGKFSTANFGEFVVANLYTQLTPGPDFQLRYLKWALTSLFMCFGDIKYGFPKIGTGMGVEWNETKELIKSVGEGYDITIIHIE